jgi:hypothetical protein
LATVLPIEKLRMALALIRARNHVHESAIEQASVVSLVLRAIQDAGQRCPIRVSSRNTCDEQIKSVLPPTGDLNDTCYTCRDVPMGDIAGLA